ncbi:MAG TPA: hypothetical protein VGH91_01675 [Gammaproteobacteria bacterium]|jgi:hypothetical protein
MMRGALVLLCLTCASAQADALTDLTAKLKTLEAPTAVKGTLDASYDEFDAKGVADKTKSARFKLDIDGSDGLQMHLSPELVQTLSAEETANAADPEKPTPNMDLLREMNPLRIQHMLSAAPTLLRDLDGATGQVTKPAKLGGADVIQLTVSLPFRAPKKDSDAAKDWQDTFTVWLDSQGMPLQVQDQIHAKFCKFFLCVTVDDSYSDTLHVVGGRLVITALSQEHQQSGLGQDAHTKTTATLQLQ